jgi:hypothetical protein
MFGGIPGDASRLRDRLWNALSVRDAGFCLASLSAWGYKVLGSCVHPVQWTFRLESSQLLVCSAHSADQASIRWIQSASGIHFFGFQHRLPIKEILECATHIVFQESVHHR